MVMEHDRLRRAMLFAMALSLQVKLFIGAASASLQGEILVEIRSLTGAQDISSRAKQTAAVAIKRARASSNPT
jgi:hypothetical protein